MSLRNNRAVLLAAAAAVLLVAGLALALFWAPEDADQGFSQRIFYVHVPIALTAYACFGWGAWKALRLLWTRESRYDLESYTAVHMGVIFGILTLVTGSIWAKISWGVWWTWSERPADALPRPLPLLLRVLHAPLLRRAGAAAANLSAVYALFGVALIPVSFLAIRLAENFIHPVVFTRDGPQMSGSMFLVFCICLAAMLALRLALHERAHRASGSTPASASCGRRSNDDLREVRHRRLPRRPRGRPPLRRPLLLQARAARARGGRADRARRQRRKAA